jgi:crotonobetainyl-CoA:carnitine CoA-transferase CaiB-like acyl-CoA transferase
VSANDQVNMIGALETYVTENMGKMTVPTPAARFEGLATSLAEPSPSLGEHSAEVLAELGFNEATIAELVEAGTVQCS